MSNMTVLCLRKRNSRGTHIESWWTIRIFFFLNFFSARGGGRGSPSRQGGGDRFFLKIPGKWGGVPGGGGGGAEGPGGCLENFLFRGGGG